MSSGIDWFFENVEQGIILEDDCLPSQSFFWFCKELLNKYKDNEKVMHIAGDNFQSDKKRGNGDYYFSVYNHCWGWATWKRSWGHFDVKMKTFPKFKKQNKLKDVFKKNQTITIEPGLYFKNKLGIRIEDTIIVRNKPRILTKITKELITI